MIIWSYAITNPDEVELLPDMLNSMSKFSDRTFLVDGGLGRGTLNHHPEHFTPISIFLDTVAEKAGYSDYSSARQYIYEDMVVSLFENPFDDPASQRNFMFKKLSEESLVSGITPDWIVMLDSDEIASNEMALGMRRILSVQPKDIVGVQTKWLNLVQDQSHCVGYSHSDWLSHPRIHRMSPDIYWSGQWHEHMVIDRSKIFQWDVRVVHSRALFRRRLLVQRGHSTIRNRSLIDPMRPPLWDDAVMEKIPGGISFPPFTPPAGEIEIPFEADALDFWTPEGDRK